MKSITRYSYIEKYLNLKLHIFSIIFIFFITMLKTHLKELCRPTINLMFKAINKRK